MNDSANYIVFGREWTWFGKKNIRKGFTSFEDYILAEVLDVPSYSKEKITHDLKEFLCYEINEHNNIKVLTPDTIDLMDIDRFLSNSNDKWKSTNYKDAIDTGMNVGSVFRLADIYTIEVLNPILDHAYIKMKSALKTRTIDYLLCFFCCRSSSFIQKTDGDFCQKLLIDLSNRIPDSSNGIAPLASYVYIWKQINHRLNKKNEIYAMLLERAQTTEKRLVSYQLQDGSWPADNMNKTGDIITTCMAIHAVYSPITIDGKETFNNAQLWLQARWKSNKDIFGKDPALDVFCIESLARCARKNTKVTFKEIIKGNAILGGKGIGKSEIMDETESLPISAVSGMNNDEDGVSPKNIENNKNQENNQININRSIFISHRSSDKVLADHLYDFLVAVGVPDEAVFCSSLPGNDVRESISAEIKQAMKTSRINFLILSKEYYESAYCMNEAGIIWFQDTKEAIPIALPEITPDKMYGFFNKDKIVRNLDNADDISFIYDTIVETLNIEKKKVVHINRASAKLQKRYNDYIKSRKK